MAKISIVGAGPGSPEYVTPAARKAVQEAQVVIGSERSLNLFKGDIKGKTLTLTGKNVDELIVFANESAENGKKVVLLSVGDPGFSGLLGSVLSRTVAKNVELHVIPGISSMQACAARLCMSWEEISLFTFHNGVSSEKKNALAAASKAGKDIMLLPEPKSFPPKEIAAFLISKGAEKTTPVAVCENLTLNDERTVETTLEEATKLSFSAMSVMVIRSGFQKRKTKNESDG